MDGASTVLGPTNMMMYSDTDHQDENAISSVAKVMK